MDISDAELILRDATINSDGTYTILRLGQDPGVEALHSLYSALHLIRRRYADDQYIPHQIAYYCGIILNFASECLQNLKAKGAAKHLFYSVYDLEMAAFNTLAGRIADEWSV